MSEWCHQQRSCKNYSLFLMWRVTGWHYHSTVGECRGSVSHNWLLFISIDSYWQSPQQIVVGRFLKILKALNSTLWAFILLRLKNGQVNGRPPALAHCAVRIISLLSLPRTSYYCYRTNKLTWHYCPVIQIIITSNTLQQTSGPSLSLLHRSSHF